MNWDNIGGLSGEFGGYKYAVIKRDSGTCGQVVITPDLWFVPYGRHDLNTEGHRSTRVCSVRSSAAGKFCLFIPETELTVDACVFCHVRKMLGIILLC